MYLFIHLIFHFVDSTDSIRAHGCCIRIWPVFHTEDNHIQKGHPKNHPYTSRYKQIIEQVVRVIESGLVFCWIFPSILSGRIQVGHQKWFPHVLLPCFVFCTRLPGSVVKLFFMQCRRPEPLDIKCLTSICAHWEGRGSRIFFACARDMHKTLSVTFLQEDTPTRALSQFPVISSTHHGSVFLCPFSYMSCLSSSLWSQPWPNRSNFHLHVFAADRNRARKMNVLGVPHQHGFRSAGTGGVGWGGVGWKNVLSSCVLHVTCNTLLMLRCYRSSCNLQHALDATLLPFFM